MSQVTNNQSTDPAPRDPFEALHKFVKNTTPAVPLTDAQKIRVSALAELLDNARVQGYIEANFGLKMLELAQVLVPLLMGAL